MEDDVADARLEATFGDDLHLSTEEPLEFRLHRCEVEQGSRVRLHEHVDVTIWSVCPASHRAEHADFGDAACARDGKDRVAVALGLVTRTRSGKAKRIEYRRGPIMLA